MSTPSAGIARARARATTLKAALAYAARGWLVIPLHNPKEGVCSCRKKNCSSPGKHPRTEHGLKDGSKDPKQITRWWEKWPDANLGILTGQESGLVVLDVDGVDGKASLQALTAAHGSRPKTLCAKTGRTGTDGKRKGAHYYFCAPVGVPIRNSAGILGKGLDIRAEGGYVVAPPSLHTSGLLYEWLAPEQPLADVPPWMLAKLAEAKPAPAPDAQRAQGEAIAEGGRNHFLASLAGTMRRRAMTPEAIEAALMKENDARCKPPLSASEVREIARSVARYEPAPPVSSAELAPEPVASKPPRQMPAPLSERILVDNPHDELGHMARVLNGLLARLGESFEKLRHFTSDVSHELRTPLAAMRSVGEVGLQADHSTEKYRDIIGSMLEEVSRLTAMIDTLLTIAHADSGEIELQRSVFSMTELVQESVGVVGVLAEDKKQTIVVVGDNEISIHADRSFLRMAVINLLDNAVKYSPWGAPFG